MRAESMEEEGPLEFWHYPREVTDLRFLHSDLLGCVIVKVRQSGNTWHTAHDKPIGVSHIGFVDPIVDVAPARLESLVREEIDQP